MIHSENGLDMDSLKDLVRHKLQWKKCQSCDLSGHQFWDGETGLDCNTTPSGIKPENVVVGACDACFGLGFYFYYDERG